MTWSLAYLHCWTVTPHVGSLAPTGKTLTDAAEEQLVQWINGLRGDGVPVISLMLKLQAKETYRESTAAQGGFAASWSWHRHFLRRHDLAIRRRTREGQTTPADAAQQVLDFSVKVKAKMRELGVSKIYNADQTGALF